MPVTQAQYQAIMGKNPSHFKGPDNPVECVSYDDAAAFCEALSKRGQGKFRLPTEAEWEYACRAGSATRYCFGDSEEQLDEYAWYNKNSDGQSHPVGQKKPNAWGLYDMHGNVWEWCSDWYGDYSPEGQENPKGPPVGSHRVLRGGCWVNIPGRCRSAYRSDSTPDDRDNAVGFRVVRTP